MASAQLSHVRASDRRGVWQQRAAAMTCVPADRRARRPLVQDRSLWLRFETRTTHGTALVAVASVRRRRA